jgi:uncharacterized protein
MIIEFSVENFMSIREEQKLSFVATGQGKHLTRNTFVPEVPGFPGLRLLKSLILYGPNASGKTNVLLALKFMREMVITSFKLKPDQEIPRKPFRLSSLSPQRPSKFRLHFIMDGKHWDYGFILDSEIVRKEWLYYYPKGRIATVFERDLEDDGFHYKYGSTIALDKRAEGIKRVNALYVSIGAQFGDPIMNKIINYFSNIKWLDDEEALGETKNLIHHENSFASLFAGFLIDADIGISRLQVDEFDEDGVFEFPKIPESASEELKNAFETTKKALKLLTSTMLSSGKKFKRLDVRLFHKMSDSDTEASFSLDEESAGTIRIFALQGPWFSAMVKGQVLLVDEIDKSLHPVLSRRLIQDFHRNPSSAQAVMTTHDTTLLDTHLFRRDQFWFTEKNNEGATVLYPLTDFHPRTDEALQKGYLAGRYGAIPIFGANLNINDTEA